MNEKALDRVRKRADSPAQTGPGGARGAVEGAAVKVPHRNRLRAPCAAVAAALAAGTPAVGAAAQEEEPAEIIAAQIRRQGFPCEEALGAERVSRAPNAAVWVLRCSNATYRVQLTPDMAARVERIR